MSDNQVNLDEIVRHLVRRIPHQCGCRGTGWILTDYDTQHQCPNHYRQQPHPEDDESNDDFPYKDTRLILDREAYVGIRGEALDLLESRGSHPKHAKTDFTNLVMALITRAAIKDPTPKDWLDAAYEAYEFFKMRN